MVPLPCAACQKQTTSLCQRCTGKPYCSENCQARDWSQHYIICNPQPSSKNRLTNKVKRSNLTNLVRCDSNKGSNQIVKRRQLHNPPMKDNKIREARIPIFTKSGEAELKAAKSSKIDLQSSKNKVIKTSIEPWMQAFPVEDIGYVPVIVLCSNSDCTKSAWVMLQSNETARERHFREINIDISHAAIPKNSEIKVNELFRVPFEGKYYRGVVLKIMIDLPFVLVRLIDYGNEIFVPIAKLKSPTQVMKDLNAFGFLIKFETPRSVSIGDTFNVKIKSTDDNIMTVIAEVDLPKITLSNIEIMPIPIKVTQYLYCLDFTNILKGYISCCVYDSLAIDRAEQISLKMTNFYMHSTGSYRPEIDEVFMALFKDGEWYRAVTIYEVNDNTLGIMSIDYGHRTTVNITNVRKITEKFTHVCLMNKCYIKGFPQNPSLQAIKGFAKYFYNNTIFLIEAVEYREDHYVIDVPKLWN